MKRHPSKAATLAGKVTKDMTQARRSFTEAVERMHRREAAAQIEAAWYEDHVAMAEPEVFCPVALKWIPRSQWEAECRRDADKAQPRRTAPLTEIVLDDSIWSSRQTLKQG